jgi:hypothetical protein
MVVWKEAIQIEKRVAREQQSMSSGGLILAQTRATQVLNRTGERAIEEIQQMGESENSHQKVPNRACPSSISHSSKISLLSVAHLPHLLPPLETQ